MNTKEDQDTSSSARDLLEPSLRLALVPGVGPHIRKALLKRFGCPGSVLSASPAELRSVPGIGSKLSQNIATANHRIDVDGEIQLCRQNDITILTEADTDYPRLLREIPDPPAVLFVQGELLPRDAISVAVVGSRHASRYGLEQAQRLASGLARTGYTVISGLARGIDAAAHRGALEAGGRTIAVLASGLLNVYPPEHKKLAAEVAQNGALLSEAPPRAQPLGTAFPRRNRIITGMSLGVVVVEATQRSGALISARHAGEQGREVFAVPGRVDSRTSQGCHRLIRDGAKLVETIDDILEEFGPLVEAIPGEGAEVIHHPAELVLNDQEQQVLRAIGRDPTGIDEVATSSGLPIHRVLSTLSVLEMRHLVHRVSGNLVARK